MSLPPGRIYGLLGPNGSGKTTLIRLLIGLASATSGAVKVLGVKMPSRANLERIGYMTQSDGIYPELSVWENLTFFAALYGQTDKADLRRSLEFVELDTRARTPAQNLSGGMRRRLSMACALAHHPSVIFLDEPTVGVDPALRVQFWTTFTDSPLTEPRSWSRATSWTRPIAATSCSSSGTGAFCAGDAAELRSRAGTENLETAFLSFATQSAAAPFSQAQEPAR